MRVRLDPEEWVFPYNAWGKDMLAILECIKYFRQPQLRKVRDIVEAMKQENFKERERVKRYGENNPASYQDNATTQGGYDDSNY